MVTSRISFTAAQKAELWERWKNGQSAAAISRALERKNKAGVERIVVLHGGIGPAERNTRFTMLIKIPRKDTTTVVAALAKHISKLPATLPDLGSRQRDACPQALHGCHQRPGLLL